MVNTMDKQSSRYLQECSHGPLALDAIKHTDENRR